MVVTFLTDYGHSDDFVGVCHGVIARIAPDARVIDITHGIPRHDIRAGALALRGALPFMPAGVHLAVVDPGVGGSRRGIAVRCAEEDRILVGPDNGLLVPAADRFGGVVEAVDVGHSPHRLEPVSATFHGRDLFAPVAAHLALGEELASTGDPLAHDELLRLELPQPRVEESELVVHALVADRFGNVVLDASHEDLAQFGLRLGGTVAVVAGGAKAIARYASTFADVDEGELIVYEDAHRQLALAVNRGSAAEQLGVGRDDELRLRPA